jgi:hypothetical protein
MQDRQASIGIRRVDASRSTIKLEDQFSHLIRLRTKMKTTFAEGITERISNDVSVISSSFGVVPDVDLWGTVTE